MSNVYIYVYILNYIGTNKYWAERLGCGNIMHMLI